MEFKHGIIIKENDEYMIAYAQAESIKEFVNEAFENNYFTMAVVDTTEEHKTHDEYHLGEHKIVTLMKM